MKDEEEGLAVITASLARVFACIEVASRELYGIARDLENALWAIFIAVMMNTCATNQSAHAQVSIERVPPGCFTIDGVSCYEPSGEVLWGYSPDDPDFLLEYYGGPVGSLVNLYVSQYQKLLEWKKLARERARRLRQGRTAAKRGCGGQATTGR